MSTANTWSARQTFNGGITGELTGNADTATKLKTAININGVRFDGSADITLTPKDLDVYSKSEIDNKKGMRKYTFSAPANAVSGKWYPIVFRRSGGNTDELASRVVITTYSSAGGYAMNNCEFNGFVMPGGWSDRGSYAAGFFSIYSTAERAIHSIISGVKDDDLCSVFYVEARAFPIKIFAEEGLNVIVPTADYAVGQTTYKWGATDPVAESTNTQTILDFKNGRGYYCSHPFISSLSGNAATATKLQTARSIGGVVFDGSANINLPGVNTTGNQNTTGNAATATKLQTARTIGGVSFDGTANINLPGVNTTGNQNTTGNAATATKLQTARTINGVSFDGSKNIELTPRSIGTINSATMSFSGGAGWFKLATVTMPQASSVVYISLIGGAGYNVGSPHQAGISELVLRAGNGNPKGITGALWRRTSVGFTNFAWVNTSGDTYDVYVEIGNYATGVNIQWDYTSNASVTIHTSPTYTANKPTGLTDGTVYVIYSSHIKPTAADVGALSLSGGQLNGALGIGTSSALGGNSIVLGDNDTGFKQNGDGYLDVYANNVHVMRFVSGSIQSNKTINITGRVNPSDYGNFDSRYVGDVRLGTRVVQTMQKGVMYEKAGHVITGLGIIGEVDGDDPAVFRPIQKYINGTWYNVAQV
ncbi:phage tail protein [Escherichia coli]|nr:phage tail protein [Escherichia coli]